MSKEFDEKIAEWAWWYHENKDTGRSIDMEIAFMKVAIDGCLELLCMAAQDIQDMNGKPRSAPLLWTPNGMTRRG
jgi:hypothetical protein